MYQIDVPLEWNLHLPLISVHLVSLFYVHFNHLQVINSFKLDALLEWNLNLPLTSVHLASRHDYLSNR